MTRTQVTSAVFRSIGHEGDTLEVETMNGKVYRYQGVTADQHAALMRAPSLGQHFGKFIRGAYPHVVVTPEAGE